MNRLSDEQTRQLQQLIAREHTDTGTRTLVFTREQVSLISQWATNAWHDADRGRFALPADSPQEAAYLADQQFIEAIQEKLRGL